MEANNIKVIQESSLGLINCDNQSAPIRVRQSESDNQSLAAKALIIN